MWLDPWKKLRPQTSETYSRPIVSLSYSCHRHLWEQLRDNRQAPPHDYQVGQEPFISLLVFEELAPEETFL